MRIAKEKYVLILLVPFIAAILAGMMFTPWQTSELEKIDTASGFDSALIRGWMTFNDVAKATGIPLVELYRLSNTSFEVDPNMPFKDIKNVEGSEDFETDNIRIAIDSYVFKENKYVCPYGIVHDEAPGDCGIYTDEDGNGNCDYALDQQ